jgi:hypothetical protein
MEWHFRRAFEGSLVYIFDLRFLGFWFHMFCKVPLAKLAPKAKAAVPAAPVPKARADVPEPVPAATQFGFDS